VRLKLAIFGGAAVILSLVWSPEQAGGLLRPAAAIAHRTGQDTARATGDSSSVEQDTARVTGESSAVKQDTPRVARDTSAAGAAGQDTTRAPADTSTSQRGDTLRAGQDTARAAADSAALESAADTAPPPLPGTLRLGLRELALPFRVDFQSQLPEPAVQRPELRPRLRNWGDIWAESVRADLALRRSELWRRASPLTLPDQRAGPLRRAVTDSAGPPDSTATGVAAVRADSAAAAAEAPLDSAGAVADSASVSPDSAPLASDTAGEPPTQVPQRPELLPDVFGDYADLGLAIQGRVEMGGGWRRFRPCDVTLRVDCDPSLVPTIKPDIQFGARVGGTITERIHVSVDYDNRREFDAANNINVYYEGLEDEILQRVEVGDVSFALPQSRYLTQGIPAGNFGFRATGQMGPIDFQTVWAQQKGDLGTQEFELGAGQGFEQSQVTILDDADYERGKFFFLFDPARLSGYPHIDIQRLNAIDAPASVRPSSPVKVYRYEALGFGLGAQVPEGFIKAVAVAVDTVRTAAGTDSVVSDSLVGLFRPLVAREDYVLHQSGLWLQLRNTLPDHEGLAVTYLAADGSSVGDFNAEEISDAHNEDPDNVPPPTLELLKGVNHRPGTATWARELHNIYRVSASPGVVKSSVELVISQGEPELGNTFRSTPGGTQVEFLKIFGLDDDPTDNKLDESQIYDVDLGSVDGTAGPAGTYIVFPTLEPFQAPPPLENVAGAVAGQPFTLDAGDRNALIYEEPNDQIRRGSNLYLLTMNYRQRFEGVRSTLSLGVGGVREGSEKVIIDGVQLDRGQDYDIDYDIGQIELRDPDRWFGDNPNARVQVRWEQKPLFQLAPTSVFGFQAKYGLGRHGELNFIGLSQTEQTLQTRPELGLEPSAVKLGGLSGRLNFEPQWLSALVDAVPGVEAEVPSSVSFDGELAMSMPNTNTQGVTYLDDFEGGSGFPASLVNRVWRQGAAPSTVAGAEDVAPLTFDLSTAGDLVWQDQGTLTGTEGTSTFGPIPARNIDDQIALVNEQQDLGEPVLWLSSFREHPRVPNTPPGPTWSSITTVISPTGRDFTTIEFLEFYVAVSDILADSVQLLLDLGTVSEDAFAIDSLGALSGAGRLDREVNPPQIWSNIDDVGLWNTGCRAELGRRLYELGDPSANCTNNNGLEDTEDLNQNGVLDTEERFFRYTVDLGDPMSPYFVRQANELLPGVHFRLYRIPLRRPDHAERVSEAEFQNIRHMRLTVINEVQDRRATLILARMRFLGSRWLKRGRAGVVASLTDTASVIDPASLVEVGPISTLDVRYVPPPGITNQAANQTDQFTPGQGERNEQSLSIGFDAVGPDERAEVYLQYPQTPRDLLAYRDLRLWAIGVQGEWGLEGEPLRFFLKMGEDAGNFYLFRTPLPKVPPDAGGTALREAWRPEIHIDFERFIALRARAEELLLTQGGLSPDSVLEVWDVDIDPAADSTYAVVISQRSRAPNLAAVRQISLGVYNSGDLDQSGEVWIDDLRLGVPVDNTGVVGQINMNVRASDFLGLNLSYASENPYFRQLAQDPSFRSSRNYRIGGLMRLDRMLPSSWGLNMPVNIDYSNGESQPLLLPRTDIDARQLGGLRVPKTKSFRSSVSLSRRGDQPLPWVGWLVDNSSLRFSYDKRSTQTSRSTTEFDAVGAGYSFRSDVGNVSFPLFPSILGRVFFFLPDALKDSRLRLTPQSVQFSTSFSDATSETRRFREIIELGEDTDVIPILSLDKRLQTNAAIGLEPLNALTGRIQFTQARELTPTDHLVQGEAARRLIQGERTGVIGLDLGWETAHSLDVNWTYRPNIAPWLTPQASFDTRFRQNRGASFVADLAGDTVLTSDFSNGRSIRLATGFNAPVLARDLLGPSAGGLKGVLLGLLDRIDIFTASWLQTLSSNFSRRSAEPDLSYQLGFESALDLRTEAGDSANRVGDGEVVNLSSGVRLPLGAALTFDYGRSNQATWSPISQIESRTTDWPNVGFNLNRLPIPGLLQRWLKSWGVRTGYRLRTTDVSIIGANQDREGETRTIPITVNVGLTTDWNFDYTLSLIDDERRDATGVTLGETSSHALQITGRIRPLSRTGTFRNPVRVSLRLSQNVDERCRRLGAGFINLPPGEETEATGDCEPFADQTIKSIDLTVGTDLPPFTLGLQGTWRDTQSELGQRPGNTLLEISVFGQFLFESGEIR
jgi:hypothetical protein